MLRDSDLEELSNELTTTVRDSKRHHDNFQNILHKFEDLLESYNQLKSDYEEEKENREKYKKQARAQDRNPFVLVLIDGDGYIFKEHLIRAGSDGGVQAARLLSDSIKTLLPPELPDNCRVMVRIYANILGLSKTLARSQLVGFEARSFSPFASSFTRAEDLFDYIDAGDKKEGADYKIREMFRLFADNYQCKHIFFGGCHDVGYLSMLTPYRGKTDRITLLKAANMHSDYDSLNLVIKEIPNVFMSTSLGGSPPPLSTSPARPVCSHFLKGVCKFGSTCKNLHLRSEQNSSKLHGDATHPSMTWTGLSNRQEIYAKLLPKPSSQSQNMIPVNKEGARIDTYLSLPSSEEMAMYQCRAKSHKLCNKYHLMRACEDSNCPFDHSDLEPQLVDVMRYFAKQLPCAQGRGCRSVKCCYGHICQRDGCKGDKPCRMGRRAHDIDLHVMQWVEPDDQTEAPDDISLSMDRDASSESDFSITY